jgi:putative DNA primase/helicase
MVATESPTRPNTHSGNLARLPRSLAPLIEKEHWVNWSWELREAKWTKPPRRPRDLQFARSNDPSSWDRYDRALQRVRDRDADGIGFMLFGSHIGAIDLDHCCQRNAETHKTRIDAWARALRAEANGTYCEVTVSGTGLRLLGTGAGANVQRKFKIDGAHPEAHIELFRNTPRFVTVSGLELSPQCQELLPLDDLIDRTVTRYDSRAQSEHARWQHTGEPNWDELIRYGVPEGQRHQVFQAVVWHLASQGRSIEQIAADLAAHPNGIAEKFIDRLQAEVTRSYTKWRWRNPPQQDALPVIKVADGQIARMVDEAQNALLDARLAIFVRGGLLVEPITVERDAADDRTTTTTVFAPLSEEKVVYLLNKQAAKFVKFDGRREAWVATNPPVKVAKTLLTLKHWQFAEVVGIVGAPTLRPDGSILDESGYDPQTRLWCEADFDLPDIPEQPSRQQAIAALQLYKDLLKGFPFASATDLSVALAAILTVVLRGGFNLTPMFLIAAPDVGTGKSYLVDLIATIVTRRACPVIAAGKSAEEMEKRLGAILLEGGTVVSLDNLAFDLESDLLCQILTQQIVKVRILGQSAVPECEWRGTLFATGNNVRVVGEVVRRALTCNLDARVERPEFRQFDFDPIDRVLADRGAYVAAALTIVRAYRAAPAGAVNVRPLGGFNAWSAMVREPLIWLGEHDPVASMETARAADPERAAAYELVRRWKKVIGPHKKVTARDIINKANETRGGSAQHRFPQFRALLVEHAGRTRGDDIDAKRLGLWLRRLHGKVYGKLRIQQVAHGRGRANVYELAEMNLD